MSMELLEKEAEMGVVGQEMKGTKIQDASRTSRASGGGVAGIVKSGVVGAVEGVAGLVTGKGKRKEREEDLGDYVPLRSVEPV